MATTTQDIHEVEVDLQGLDPESGVEVERELDEPIEEPFNPEKVRIQTRQPVVELLVRRYEHEDLDLEPDFQRLEVWDRVRQSRFIESLLLRIPIPVFYVAADGRDRWSVVDGVQRLSTIFRFTNNEYRLTGLEFLQDYEGLTYDQLPYHMQRRISETQLIVNVIDDYTPPAVMYNVFLRVNTGGVKLNAQEIRHAVNPGRARHVLRDLAKSKEFLDATDHTVNDKRMVDRELVLRFMAFHMRPWTEYDTNSLDGYLHDAMKRLNSASDDQVNLWIDDFIRTMAMAKSVIGNDAFRKPRSATGRRRPVNKALFETWSTQLARLSDNEVKQILGYSSDVRDRFNKLFAHDRDFDISVSYSTSSIRSVHKRHRTISDIISDFV